METGRLMRPKRKPTTMTKERAAEIEEEKRRRQKQQRFKSHEAMIAALNRKAASIARRTKVIEDNDVVADRQRLEAAKGAVGAICLFVCLFCSQTPDAVEAPPY